MKVLKILQSFSQGTFIAFMLLLFGVNCMGEPGYLDFDNLPETNFTCAGKVIGGYYADLEASCQMFHVCTIGQGDEPMDIKFLCLNGTVFDQETRVCERVDEVDCSKSEKFYYLNLELYGNTIIPSPEEGSSEEDGNDGASSTTTSSTTTTTTSTTTVKPPTTTPSRRFIFNNNHNNKGPFTQPISSSTVASPMHAFSSTPKSPADDEDYEYEDEVEYGAGEKPANQGGSGSLDGGSFSPQQFTLQQQQPKTEAPAKAGQSPVKPAVSFQQQHFQNGGTLTVTNSHVTVTTHTTGVGGPPTPNAAPSNGTSKPKVQTQQILLTHKQKQQFEHQKRQQQEQLLQQQAITKQHEELQKRQQEAAVKQQQKALQQQQKQVQQHEAEIKNHQALLLLHTQKINRAQQKQPTIPSSSSSSSGAPPPTQRSPFLGGSGFGSGPQQQQQQQQTQAPKRIPLLASASPLVLPSPSSPLTPFRLRAQGFKLPPSVAPPPTQQRQDILRQQQQQLQQHQQQHHHHQQHPEQERFEGYRRQPPPQYPVRFQVPLHLPFEQPLRNQKDISLQFDPEVEDLTQIPQHKELKRSDPPFHHTPGLAPPPAPPPGAKEPASERKSGPVQSEAVPPGADPGTVPGVEPVVEYEYDDEEEEDYSSEGDEPGPGSHGLDSAKSNTNSEFVIAQNGPPNGGSSDETEHPGEAARRSDGRPNSTSNSRSGNSNSSSNSGSTSSSNSNSNDRSAKKLPSGSGSNTSRFIINNEHHKSHGSGGGGSGTAGSSSSGAAPRVQPSARSPPAGPKVIVTTSTSIRDNHGRTINYSITSNGGSFSTAASHSEAGSALTTSRPAQSPQQQQQPVTRGYDEYKDERDVLSDPFFRDVPRTGPVVRTRRSPSAVPRGRRSFILLVPRFM